MTVENSLGGSTPTSMAEFWKNTVQSDQRTHERIAMVGLARFDNLSATLNLQIDKIDKRNQQIQDLNTLSSKLAQLQAMFKAGADIDAGPPKEGTPEREEWNRIIAEIEDVPAATPGDPAPSSLAERCGFGEGKPLKLDNKSQIDRTNTDVRNSIDNATSMNQKDFLQMQHLQNLQNLAMEWVTSGLSKFYEAARVPLNKF